MSDYNQVNNYTVKDALPSGDPEKVINGSDIDAELSAISAAITSKINNTDIANQVEAEAGTNNTKVMTPLRSEQHVTAWSNENGGFVGDIYALTDPNADTLLGWDDSSSAVINYTIGSGLASNTTSLELDINSLSGTTPFANDKVLFWDATDSTNKTALISTFNAILQHDTLDNIPSNDHIDHSTVSVTAGTGLTGGGDITATRTFNLDISALTNMDISETSSSDSILVNDGSVMKQMNISDSGVKVVEFTTSKTLVQADSSTLLLLTGGSTATCTIPPNSTTAYQIGAVIYVGSRDTAEVGIAPGSGVTLTSINTSDTTTTQNITAGGLAVLIKVNTDQWMLSGDLA
jgi:hypothetical protein